MTIPDIQKLSDEKRRIPLMGQYLYASCAGEDYGQILAVGQDGNGVDTIDIELYDAGNLMLMGKDSEFPTPPLSTLELPEGTKIILRSIQWRWLDEKDGCIVCNTPGNGCFRCTKLFSLSDTRTKFDLP